MGAGCRWRNARRRDGRSTLAARLTATAWAAGHDGRPAVQAAARARRKRGDRTRHYRDDDQPTERVARHRRVAAQFGAPLRRRRHRSAGGRPDPQGGRGARRSRPGGQGSPAPDRPAARRPRRALALVGTIQRATRRLLRGAGVARKPCSQGLVDRAVGRAARSPRATRHRGSGGVAALSQRPLPLESQVRRRAPARDRRLREGSGTRFLVRVALRRVGRRDGGAGCVQPAAAGCGVSARTVRSPARDRTRRPARRSPRFARPRRDAIRS